MEFTNPRAELIYQDLISRHKRTSLHKRDLAKEMGLSVSTIDLYMHKGIGVPDYKKLGNAKNSKVIFNIVDVAEYLSQTIKTA